MEYKHLQYIVYMLLNILLNFRIPICRFSIVAEKSLFVLMTAEKYNNDQLHSCNKLQIKDTHLML